MDQFEPSSSYENSSPYSERSTPPYLLWAIDLFHVLDDYEGFELFTEFLKTEAGTDNELSFWYACKGFRKQCEEHAQNKYDSPQHQRTKEEHLTQLTKGLFQEYIDNSSRNKLTCVSEQVKQDIQNRLSASSGIQADIFDAIQHEVETNLRIRHAQFAESDLYIAFVQRAQSMHEEGGEGAAVAPLLTSSMMSSSGGIIAADVPVGVSCASSLDVGSASTSDAVVVELAPARLALSIVPEEDDGIGVDVNDNVVDVRLSADVDDPLDWITRCDKILATSAVSVDAGGKKLGPQAAVACNDVDTDSENSCRRSIKSHTSASLKSDAASCSSTVERRRTPSDGGKKVTSSQHPTILSGGDDSGGVPRRVAQRQQMIAASPSPSTNALPPPTAAKRKLTHNTLARSTLERMHASTIRPSTSTQSGVPPNPYHSTRPYQPYLPTSTQDSELQSMSSDANTESSVSGHAFRISERNAMRNARHNVDIEKPIPRTKRPQPSDSIPKNMMDESFRRNVFRALHQLYAELKEERNVKRALRQADGEPLRDVVQHFVAADAASRRRRRERDASTTDAKGVCDAVNVTKNVAVSDDEDDNDMFDDFEDEQKCAAGILDTHYSRLGWKDTPKHSPMRSPGFSASGRRRSPPPQKITQPFNNAMTASYPSTSSPHFGAAALPCGQQMLAAAMAGLSLTTTAPAHQPQISPRHRNHQFTVPQQQKQQAGITLASFESFYPSVKPKNSSAETSGVWSGGPFSDPSTVSSTQSSQKSKARTVLHAGTVASKGYSANASRGVAMPQVIAEKKGSRNSGALVNHEAFGAPSSGAFRKSFAAGSLQQAAQGDHTITVVYFLSNEPTPFRTKFVGSKMDLKDFKSLLPKKTSAFKYYFKSEVADIGEVWEELSHDSDIVPFHRLNEVTARVDSIE